MLHNGVEVTDVSVGRGPPALPGQWVHVRYAGTLTDGKRFDAGSIGFRLGAAVRVK